MQWAHKGSWSRFTAMITPSEAKQAPYCGRRLNTPKHVDILEARIVDPTILARRGREHYTQQQCGITAACYIVICGNSTRSKYWLITISISANAFILTKTGSMPYKATTHNEANNRDIVENHAVIKTAPEFHTIHHRRTASYSNRQYRILPVYKKAIAAMHAMNKVWPFH